MIYRHVYGLERAQAVIFGINGGAGGLMMYSADPVAGIEEPIKYASLYF